MNWRIEFCQSSRPEVFAGQLRYLVIDKLGNVACVTNNPYYANAFCDYLNARS